jgi:hypothetical protein
MCSWLNGTLCLLHTVRQLVVLMFFNNMIEPNSQSQTCASDPAPRLLFRVLRVMRHLTLIPMIFHGSYLVCTENLGERSPGDGWGKKRSSWPNHPGGKCTAINSPAERSKSSQAALSISSSVCVNEAGETLVGSVTA